MKIEILVPSASPHSQPDRGTEWKNRAMEGSWTAKSRSRSDPNTPRISPLFENIPIRKSECRAERQVKALISS